MSKEFENSLFVAMATMLKSFCEQKDDCYGCPFEDSFVKKCKIGREDYVPVNWVV